MAIQADKLTYLLQDAGIAVVPVRTNTDPPPYLTWVWKIPFVRTFINTLSFLRKLQKAVSSTDKVYFLTGFFGFFFWITYPALILIKLNRKPVILSARGGAAGDFFKRYRFFLRPILRHVDIITTPSGFLQKAFMDAFSITPIIVPNIADLRQFRFRKRNLFRPKLIVTRNLFEIYNVKCVIKAFSLVKLKYADATLTVIGDGDQRPLLERLAVVLKLGDSVKFHGRVPHEKIQSYYDHNDIFINASNVDNLPGTILEAFACGLPVVSTKAGGIPYLVENGKTGFLANINDHETLANRVIELIENPSIARSMAKSAKEETVKYDWPHVRQILLPLFQDNILS